MNAMDILNYGDRTLMQALEGLPDTEWTSPGACGEFSARDLMVHMGTQELILADILGGFVTPGVATPYFDRMTELGGDPYTMEQIAQARAEDRPVATVLDTYHTAHTRVMELAAQIPVETLRQPSTIPWYGMEYALDDLIVYFNYGHKREHSGQLGLFRDRFRS